MSVREVTSGAFEYWNVEGIFTFVVFENTKNFVQQKRLYFGKNEYRDRKSF